MKEGLTIKCQSCGSSQIEILENGVGRCKHCSSTMLLPKQNADIISLLDAARVYRESYNYDLAIKTYQFVLEKDANELAAYEGILLSEYGIEYVKDAYTGRYIPTCHRAHFSSITENNYYKTLLELANSSQRESIENRAKEIDKLQASISEQLKKEDSYDVFISYKSTDKFGEKTEDSVIAREIYEELVKKNYKVFLAEKTLENKLGSEYEPIIFKALHTSKVFILVGTSKENVESPWVRNEWSRFIDRIKNNEDKLSNASFIPVFKNMSPYDMPKVNNQFIQGIDASKIGFALTIVDGVERICKPQEQKNVIETFNDVNNFMEFERIRKEKIREVKHNNWVDLQTNPKKKTKKILYNIFLSLPLIFFLTTFALVFDFRTWIITSLNFILFIISDVFLLVSTIAVSIVHSKRFKLKVLLQTVLPIVFNVVFVATYIVCMLCVPITMSGMTANYFSYATCSNTGLLYSIYSNSYSGIDLTVKEASIYSYNWRAMKNYKYKKGDKVVLKFPDEINNADVSYCAYDYIPQDVDVIVAPKYARGIAISTKNANFDEVYFYGSEYDSDYNIEIYYETQKNGERTFFGVDKSITIYYAKNKPSVSTTNGLNINYVQKTYEGYN